MKKIVIIGGGFAGLTLARKIDKKLFNVTIIDRNNYHQFQPLLYQVVMSGIEPESICFPLRRIFNGCNITYHMADVQSIDRAAKQVRTDIGNIDYDYLVIATGAQTNYFNNSRIAGSSFPVKSVEDALRLRCRIQENLEAAAVERANIQPEQLLNIMIVGGGASGVEIAGALAEMKRYVVKRDFSEYIADSLHITLVEGADRLLTAMSERSSAYALTSLCKMGVEVMLNTRVKDYDGTTAVMDNGDSYHIGLLIWVSGVTVGRIEGIPDQTIGPSGRVIVDRYSRLSCDDSVFAIGDVSIMSSAEGFLHHPQVAPVAIQQAKTLARNFSALSHHCEMLPFVYKNRGSMATIGRNKAVVDIGKFNMHGFIAWVAWLTIHLRSNLGLRNKIIVLINWVWNYFSYHKAIGLILFKQKKS